MARTYKHGGHEVFVGVSPSIRIEGGNYYCSMWRSAKDGQLHLLRSPNLPDRKTRKTAQSDLDKFAARKGLCVVQG